MSKLIKEMFSKEVPVKITKEVIKEILNVVMLFELRDEHPLTLNSPLLGVNKIAFTTNDRIALFDIFDVDEHHLRNTIHQIPSVNKDFKVTSDPFNLLCSWIIHKILVSSLSSSDKEKGSIAVLKYLQYKFFTSVVNNSFRHGTTKDVMQNLYETMNLKFDIRKYETWKNLVENRAKFQLEVHGKTMKTFTPDDKVLYFISDTQTKVRNQIVKVANLFYDYKKTNDFIEVTSSTTVLDGEKIIKEVHTSYEHIAYVIFNKSLSEGSFVNDSYLKALLKLYNTLNLTIVKRMMHLFVMRSKEQGDKKTTVKEIHTRDGLIIYEGNELLIDRIVAYVYTDCLKKKVDMRNRLSIFAHAKRLFSIHKENDTELANIKASVTRFLEDNRVSKRSITLSSLTIFFCMYIILLTFDYFKKR